MVNSEMNFAGRAARRASNTDDGNRVETGSPMDFSDNPRTGRAARFPGKAITHG
jgi:ABC-type polar amino acid transport system ATPase subunit